MAVGLTVESSWLFVLLKIVAALLGFFLLAFGHRLPPFSGGLFCLLVSLGLAMSRLAKASYLLATLAALLGALLGAVAGALWPRAMLAPLASVMGISLLAWAAPPVTLSFPRLAVPGHWPC